jgi:hypothetical protein
MPTSSDECFRDDLDPSQHFGAASDRRCRFAENIWEKMAANRSFKQLLRMTATFMRPLRNDPMLHLEFLRPGGQIPYK